MTASGLPGGKTTLQVSSAAASSNGSRSPARALATGPVLLLADEPTGNLDPKSADEVFALLQRFNSRDGMTVLFVTHNMALAERCGKTIQVVDGRVTG